MGGLRAGDLDRRITLLRATTHKNSLNDDVEVWAPLATVWAQKQDVSDGERVRAREVAASITTRFRIRWSTMSAGLTARDRIGLGGLVYDIVGNKEIGRREGLEITANARPDLVG